MSKKVYVTLPDVIYAELERWAKHQGQPTASLAAFLIETGINQENDKGDLPEKSIPHSL